MVVSQELSELRSKIKYFWTCLIMKIIVYFGRRFLKSRENLYFLAIRAAPLIYKAGQEKYTTCCSLRRVLQRHAIKFSRPHQLIMFSIFSSGGNMNSSPKPVPFQKNRTERLCFLLKLRSHTLRQSNRLLALLTVPLSDS